MQRSETITKLAPALALAQSEIKAIGKDRENSHFRNRYATLDAIAEAVRPVLAKHGLSVLQDAGDVRTDESGTVRGFVVESTLLHSSGEWMSNAVVMPIAQVTPQGIGSALTYGRRYGISALLCLATDEDDDGNAVSANAAPAPKPPAPRRAAAPATPKAPDGVVTMPIGKKKGTPIADIPTGDLESALAWAKENQKEYAVDTIMAELTRRAAAEGGELSLDDARPKAPNAQERA